MIEKVIIFMINKYISYSLYFHSKFINSNQFKLVLHAQILQLDCFRSYCSYSLLPAGGCYCRIHFSSATAAGKLNSSSSGILMKFPHSAGTILEQRNLIQFTIACQPYMDRCIHLHYVLLWLAAALPEMKTARTRPFIAESTLGVEAF